MKEKNTDNGNGEREEDLIALTKVLGGIKQSMAYYATKDMWKEEGIARGFQLQLRERIAELAEEMETQDGISGVEYARHF